MAGSVSGLRKLINKPSVLRSWYFAFWVLYFFIFWTGAFTHDDQGNLLANHINLWGDWAAHFTMGSQLAYQKLSLEISPFILGQSLSYPFAVNLISALLIKAGMPFFEAFIVPSFFYSILLVAVLFMFYKTWLRSDKSAILASLLFLFNGGLGFYYYFEDIWRSPSPWLTALNPPRQYTNIEPLLYRWISVIDSMIIPQRAFALGFPVALLGLTLVFRSLKKRDYAFSKLLVAGLAFGILPLLHTHSFLSVFVILAAWMVIDVIRQPITKKIAWWLQLAAVSSLVSGPIIFLFFSQQVSNGFWQWFPGWYSHTEEINWLWFWLKNWGVVPWLAVVGFIWQVKRQQFWMAPFFIIFVLANLFLFQPFIWDNTKLIVWASLGFSGLTISVLIQLWKKSLLWKIMAAVIFIISIFAGGLDAYRALRFDLHQYTMYTQEELQLAQWAKEETPVEGVWLTGDNHNHWLFNLTGRQAVMTYRGWLWTHGYDYQAIEADVGRMYLSPQKSDDLFEQYRVDYVLIGPNERDVWQADERQFNQLKLIKNTENYQIYEL